MPMIIDPTLASAPVALGLSFVGGLLSSLSPCVYPMIPIVASVVAGRDAGPRKKLHAFLRSLSYAAGLALVYAGFGLFAALGGHFFGSISTSAWAQGAAGLIFVVLALGMLEILPLPYLWPTAGPRESSGFGGAFLLGATSGLVVSPCTSPVLLALLTYVAAQGAALYGAALLLAFSLGMTLLLVVTGTLAGLAKHLPESGPWLLWMKKGAALVLLTAGGIYLWKAAQLVL